MFADSFSVLCIHCVTRGLAASCLYKCPASRGDSMRQHGLLVTIDPMGIVHCHVEKEANRMRDCIHLLFFYFSENIA